MDCPCKDCPDRTYSCHSKCAKYLEWRKQLDELHKKLDEARKINDFMFAVTNKRNKRNRRR